MNVAKQIEKIQLKIVKTKNDLLCEKHNTYYCYECIECKKEHEVIRDHENKVNKRIKESGLDKRKRESTFKNFNWSNAPKQYNVCKEFADNWKESFTRGKSIFMIGNIGGGKTHLACAIANQVIQEHYANVCYITFSRMAITMRDAQNTHQIIAETMQRFTKCELLIVDEIGIKDASDYEFSLINEIIDCRYGEMLPTILITNMNWQQAGKKIGERIISRLTETGKSLRFNNEDYRKIIAKGV